MNMRQIQALLAQSFSMEVSTGAISGMLKKSVWRVRGSVRVAPVG